MWSGKNINLGCCGAQSLSFSTNPETWTKCHIYIATQVPDDYDTKESQVPLSVCKRFSVKCYKKYFIISELADLHLTI